eukprot:8473493-Heterocapsa_arctica.AAC.1
MWRPLQCLHRRIHQPSTSCRPIDMVVAPGPWPLPDVDRVYGLVIQCLDKVDSVVKASSSIGTPCNWPLLPKACSCMRNLKMRCRRMP